MCTLRSHPFSETWRFVLDNNTKFTSSQIKYIVRLYCLSQNGYGVKNVELAKALGLSKPSVHNMLKALAELGVIKQEFFGLVFFTDEGYVLAQKYSRCHTLLENKMSEICGNGAVSENAICCLLADMPIEKINELCNGKVK